MNTNPIFIGGDVELLGAVANGIAARIAARKAARETAEKLAREAAEREARSARMAEVRRLGQEGENLAKIKKNKRRIPSATGKKEYRIPDILDDEAEIIGEVKNVKSLSYTSQLKDFVAYAEDEGYDFVLIVRKDTKLSKPLQRAIAEHNIILQRTLP